MVNENKNDKIKVIAVIPAYNEDIAIGSVVLRTKKYVDSVIVVDDGSTDATVEISKSAGAEVISHKRNMGYGYAVRTGIKNALKKNADIIVLLDGDGQHNPDEIPKLIGPIIHDHADMVVGSRFLDKDKNKDIPKYRRFGIKFLTKLTNIPYSRNKKLTDSQSGFRAYSKKILEINPISKGMSISSETIMLAQEKNFRIKEVPITCRYFSGNRRNALAHGLGVVGGILSFIKERHPLIFFGTVGTICFIFGGLLAMRTLSIYYSVNVLPIGTLVLSLVFIIFGTLSLFSALILDSIKNLMKRSY